MKRLDLITSEVWNEYSINRETVDNFRSYVLNFDSFSHLICSIYDIEGSVVISNGSSHGFNALLYALTQIGIKDISLSYPVIPLITDIIGMHNMNVTSNASIKYVCSPNNPTGRIYDEGQNGMIIWDSAYVGVMNNTFKEVYAKFDPSNTIIMFSLSKLYGLSGQRIGGLIFPKQLNINPLVIDLCRKYVYNTTLNINASSEQLLRKIVMYTTKQDFLNIAYIINHRREMLITYLLKIDDKLKVLSPPHMPFLFVHTLLPLYDILYNRGYIIGKNGVYGINNTYRISLTERSECYNLS